MLASEMIAEMSDHGFSDIDPARALGFLNDTYYEFCALELWPFLETQSSTVVTTIGNKLLITPTDLRAVLGITNLTIGYPLSPERRTTLTKRFANTLTITGQPGFYYPIGSTINLFRIPDQVYTLEFDYLKRPAALTTPAVAGGTDTAPIFPVDHHRVIVLGALSKANAMEDDPDTATFFDNLYQAKIEKVRNDLWGWQYDRPDRIIDLFENDSDY